MSVLAALLVRSPRGVLLSCSARRAGRARAAVPGERVWSRHVQRAAPFSARDSERLFAARIPSLPPRALTSLGLLCLGSGWARPYTPGVEKRAGPGEEQRAGPGEEQRAERSLKELYENPWTIPNLLSMTRIGLSPVLGYLIVGEDFHIALGIFALAGVTDLLDGYIARNWANQKSALGSALDPLADKILISVLYVCLTYAGLIPVPLTVMIILRDIALIAAVFYVRYKTLPPPRTAGKYFNPCYATARLEPTFISKMNTAVQLILVAASLAAPVFNFVDSVYLQALWCITAFTTAASGYSYYRHGQKTVKVLNK